MLKEWVVPRRRLPTNFELTIFVNVFVKLLILHLRSTLIVRIFMKKGADVIF